MNMKERMAANLPYKAWMDGLAEDRQECRKKIYKFNNMSPDQEEESLKYLKEEILGKAGSGFFIIEKPFRCDYGYNIEIGDNFFANYNFVVLDVGKVKIGNNVQIAPNVGLYTAGHPVHPDSRNSGYEYGIDITIGDNVWLGGGVIVLPGVTIGDKINESGTYERSGNKLILSPKGENYTRTYIIRDGIVYDEVFMKDK